MDKPTLEHLAPYLPYGLTCLFLGICDDGTDHEVCLILGATIDDVIIDSESGQNDIPYDEIKPILRPLSELTKELEHKGERFVPIDYINGQFALSIPTKIEWNQSVKNSNLHFVLAEWIQPQKLYSLFELLFKWHFDVFGLIAAGLAVDINTLEGGSHE